MASRYVSHKDRRAMTAAKKRAKNYSADITKKYKPLVPKYVQIVRDQAEEHHQVNPGSTTEQDGTTKEVEAVEEHHQVAGGRSPNGTLTVIPETQLMDSEVEEHEAPSTHPVSEDSGNCSAIFVHGWIKQALTRDRPLFRPDVPASSTDESDDESPNVDHMVTKLIPAPAVTTVPETPSDEMSECSVVDSSTPAKDSITEDIPLDCEEIVSEGLVVGEGDLCPCRNENVDDNYEDEDSSDGSIPDGGAHLYQELPDMINDNGIILQHQPPDGDPPGGDDPGDDDDPVDEDEPFGDPNEPLLQPDGDYNPLNPLVQERLIQSFSQKFAARRAELLAGHYIAEGFYAFLVENRQLLSTIRRYPKCYKTIRRRADQRLPPITIEFLIRKLDTNEEFSVTDDKFNAKDYGNPLEYHVVETWTRISLTDVLEMVDGWHFMEGDDEGRWRDMNGAPLLIDLSWDGVALDRKNDQVLEVFSMRLTDCNRIIPLTIYIGDYGCKDTEKLMRSFIEEIRTVNVKVRYYLADSKARAVLLNMVSVTGYFGCQFCMAEGERNEVPMVNAQGAYNRRGGAVLWTDATFDEPPRTHQMYTEQAAQAEEAQENVFGVKGRSAVAELFDDVMVGVPIDSFHCAFLGLAKKIINEILGVSNIYRARRENRQVRQTINARYPSVRVPSEVQRPPRKIDDKSYKASEWKILAMVGFPIVINALNTEGLRPEARAFTLFVFMLRAMYLSDEEYTTLKANVDLKATMRRFYRSYVEAFGPGACTPTVHLFSHLLEQRDRDYLSATSTESFESFYAILKNTYRKGTPSIGKQMISNVLLHYFGVTNHNCRKSFRYRPEGRDMKNDSYVRSVDGFLQVQENLPDRMIRCRKILTDRYTPDVVRNLPFDLIGVAKWRQLGAQEVIISADEISAKAVRVENVLVTLPFDCLYS